MRYQIRFGQAFQRFLKAYQKIRVDNGGNRDKNTAHGYRCR